MSAPREGDPAPDFQLDGTDGPFKLSEHRGERVVLLFYPGDNTAVCTKQFCSYAARPDDMQELHATVVGISAQDVESHNGFQQKHSIPVPLLADTDKSVARSYGVAAPLVGTRRAVFVVDEQGIVRHGNVHRLGLDYQSVDEIKAVLDAMPPAPASTGAAPA